jgi:purine-binding chemotaxis protein CheW
MAEVKESKPSKQDSQLVVFSIKDEEFGVDITQVKEIVKLADITFVPKAPTFIEGVINLRGHIVAIIDLAKRLGFPTSPRGEETRIIVVEIGSSLVGMIVDAVSEVLKLPSGSIEEVPSLIETEVPEHYIRGVGKLPSKLLILLDLDKVLSPEETMHIEQHIKSMAPEPEKKEKP